MSNNTPAPISTLPLELIDRIINHVDSTSDIRRLTTVNRATRLFANMRLWEFCHTQMLKELASDPNLVQQQFASLIRTIDWNVARIDRWSFSHLQFPRVQELSISNHEGQFGIVRLAQFIQPALKNVRIMDYSRDINQVSTNYIPLLVNCPELRSLWIEIDPQASDAEFLTTVTACRQLEHLVLEGPVCRVLKSQMFQYLACQSRLQTFRYMAAGLRMTRNLIQPTMATLAPRQTIFNHLTSLRTGMDGAVARELFPRMPTITQLTLYVDQHDDIINWLPHLPRLSSLSLVARAEVWLTPLYLVGLQNLSLSTLEIGGSDGCAFNGPLISVNDIDTIFGSHGSLNTLAVGWSGDATNTTFLQHSPHLLIQRVVTQYPGLQSLILLEPCGPLNLRRMPRATLNGNLRYLDVEGIVAPGVDRNLRPEV